MEEIGRFLFLKFGFLKNNGISPQDYPHSEFYDPNSDYDVITEIIYPYYQEFEEGGKKLKNSKKDKPEKTSTKKKSSSKKKSKTKTKKKSSGNEKAKTKKTKTKRNKSKTE